MEIPGNINVTIMSADEVVWEGSAKAISSENNAGPFDVLPDHAHFITLIKNSLVVVHLLDETQNRTFKLEQAVLFFQNNTAKIYIHTRGSLKGAKNGRV